MIGCFTLTSGRSKGVMYSDCCKKICFYEPKSKKNHCVCCDEEINVQNCRTVDAKWDDKKGEYTDLSCFKNPKISEAGAKKLMSLLQEHIKPGEDKQKYFNLIKQFSHTNAHFGVIKLSFAIRENKNIANRFAYLSKILRENKYET